MLAKYHEDSDDPVSEQYWSEKDTWSRDRIREVQDEKIAAVAPFLYENSGFYRTRFDRLGVAPTDIALTSTRWSSDWPVVTKDEMMADAEAEPAVRHVHDLRRKRMERPRLDALLLIRIDRDAPRVPLHARRPSDTGSRRTPARLYSGGLRKGDSALRMVGFGPHVFAWGAQQSFTKLGLPTIPAGGLDSKARVGDDRPLPPARADHHAVVRAVPGPHHAGHGA